MDHDIGLLIIQMVVIMALLIITLLLIRQNKAIGFERRIGRYAIDSLKDESLSFFDKLEVIYGQIVIKLRRPFNKINLFKNMAKRYDKYITYNQIYKSETIDFVIHKCLISLLFLILAIFSQVLQLRVISLVEMICVLVIGFYIYDIYLKYDAKHKKRKIENELLKAVIIMNNAFRAGKSTLQALEITKNELPEPLRGEFLKMYNDMSFGLSLDAAFERFAIRVDVAEARYLTSTLTILNKTGGNIVKVFSSIERSLFDKKKLNEELKNLTVSSNLIVKILLFLPFIFGAIILFLNHDYFKPLIDTSIGNIILLIILVIYLLYCFVLQKVMKVKV